MSRPRKGGLRIGRVLFALLVVFLLGFLVSFFLRLREFVQSDESRVDRRGIRIQVLNGSGEPGLAQELTFFLREQGFDVVDYGNAECQFEETVVVDRVDGQLSNAKAVARTIGWGLALGQIDRSLLLEVTVVIGKDFRSYFPRIRQGLEKTGET